jgi:Tol biopolymer transport system component
MKRAALALFSILLLVASPAIAQKKGLLDSNTFMDMESISNPAISPNGQQIVFTRTWVDKVKDQFRSNLWLVDVDGSRVRELTSGSWRDIAPVWSPDGKRIAFISDRDGTMQVHTVWLETREVAQLTHVERAPTSLRFSPDGKYLACTIFVPDNDPILSVKLPEKPRGAEWAKPAVLVNRLSWARDGEGPIPMGFNHVFVIDSLLGGTPRQLTSGKFSHSDPEWSSDGKTIYFTAIRKPEAEYQRGDSEIYAIDINSLEVKALTDRKGPDSNPRISPDGRWIAYTGYDEKNFTNHVASIYVMDSQGGGKRIWADNLMSSPQQVSWAKDGSGVYFTVEEQGSTHVYFAPG